MIEKMEIEVPLKSVNGKEILDIEKQKDMTLRYEEALRKFQEDFDVQLKQLSEVSSNVAL